MEVRHDWLSSSPHEGFEQMRLKSRPREPSPSLTRVGANFYSTVKQQDYSASVWLRRKDKLEHVSQLLFPSLLSYLLDLYVGALVGCLCQLGLQKRGLVQVVEYGISEVLERGATQRSQAGQFRGKEDVSAVPKPHGSFSLNGNICECSWLIFLFLQMWEEKHWDGADGG